MEWKIHKPDRRLPVKMQNKGRKSGHIFFSGFPDRSRPDDPEAGTKGKCQINGKAFEPSAPVRFGLKGLQKLP